MEQAWNKDGRENENPAISRGVTGDRGGADGSRSYAYPTSTGSGKPRPNAEFLAPQADGTRPETAESVRSVEQAWNKESPKKECSSCDRVLPIASFTRESLKRDGRSAYCRSCKNEHQKARLARLREDPTEQFLIKRAAHRAVQRAMYAGTLVRPDACSACNQAPQHGSLHAHHDDYARPLEVRWLCRLCHIGAHRAPPLACVICGAARRRRGSTCGASACIRARQRAAGSVFGRRVDKEHGAGDFAAATAREAASTAPGATP